MAGRSGSTILGYGRCAQSYVKSMHAIAVRRPRCEAYNVSSLSAKCTHRWTVFSAVGKRLYFDTHAIVQILEARGFTTPQSEIIVSAFLKIMNANTDLIYQDMVSKVQQEISLQQVMSHIASAKKDMIILEKSEFSALRTENEDEITKVRANNKLDFNLEKSRVKEMHSQQDRALTQTKRKIDTEVAGLKTMLESNKLDTIKYLAGSVFTCLTIVLGFYRLWM
ncbi:mitochondrial calcium uniporter regulator 1 isoform 5-T5 [Anomaloglossus baeobatrachus]|uniref:mitochondrial calcium uniporter regulator 1 isoform X5 n=1 Tax=Anomaloglossus baeobatrachus TaxID=238106 RepID=UPI003F507CF4